MKLIVANWKMNFLIPEEGQELYLAIEEGIKNIETAEIVICPPFVHLGRIHRHIYQLDERSWNTRNRPGVIKMGAQNCFWEETGAFTGEISPWMLRYLGCRYVILGHSERRQLLNETNEMVEKKLKIALEAKLCPILCIGESWRERERGATFEALARQIQGLNGLPSLSFEEKFDNLTVVYDLAIAYEPVWAIGTGRPCSVADAREALEFLRSRIGGKVRFLYGGSVDSQNAAGYFKEASFDGLLVGEASLDREEFVKIIQAIV